MQKLYLLLRNNKQSGPYSLDELLQLQLRPLDLIWIEGKSSGWAYPSEIASLKPYLSATPAATPAAVAATATPTPPASQKTERSTGPQSQQPIRNGTNEEATPAGQTAGRKVHISLPGGIVIQQPSRAREESPADAFERKAEELRKRAQNYAQEREAKPDHHQPQTKPDKHQLDTKYSRTMDDVKADYTNWVFKQKTNKKSHASKKQLLTALVILLVLAGIYGMVYSFITTKTKTQPVVRSVQPVDMEEPPATETIQPESDQTETTPAEMATGSGSEMNTETSSQVTSQQSKGNPNAQEKNDIAALPNSVKAPVTASGKPQEKVNELTAAGNIKGTKDLNKGNQVTPGQQVKKKVAEPADGVAGKQKKNEEPETQNNQATASGPVALDNNSTPQQAEEAPVTGPPLADLVKITATEQRRPDQWMMGVKELKLTLQNHSDETIQKAAVEVRYYNEQNVVVEKKTVYFTNIAPKKSGTVTVPDQRLADHADYHLIAVRGQ